MSCPTILTSNSTSHAPGGVLLFAGMSSEGAAVNTTEFGSVPTACPVLHVTGHVVVMVASPWYWMAGPPSVQGGSREKFALQSRSSRKLWIVSFVPPWMLPVPRSILTRTTSPTWLT